MDNNPPPIELPADAPDRINSHIERTTSADAGANNAIAWWGGYGHGEPRLTVAYHAGYSGGEINVLIEEATGISLNRFAGSMLAIALSPEYITPDMPTGWDSRSVVVYPALYRTND